MRLWMREIRKSFDTNQVLKGVDFALEPGQIHALLGENGAGKSTLMNILGGVLRADSGEILLDGKPTVFYNPRESLDAGIGFIHQELNLVNDLAVYENMFLGRELRKKNGLLAAERMAALCQEVFDQIGIDLNPLALVRDLDASYKQIVEIARALLMQARVIIMDEPTTSLTDVEIARVFDMMRVLKDQGVGIVFISHKLREVLEICDCYTVLRDGDVVADGRLQGVTASQIARDMTGHEVRGERLQRKKRIGAEALRVEKLTVPRHFQDISFSVRAGEILGFTGLLGDGRSELFQTVFGGMPEYSGEIYVKNTLVAMHGTHVAMKHGIGYLPRNRKENGIVKDLSIVSNASLATLPRYRRMGLVRKALERRAFQRQSDALHIKMESMDDLITSLSGGNQQKVVLAKWLSADPAVMIFDNPTQGVDVGAKEDLYDIILALAERGVAVVVLSSEAQEIIRLCDRAIVLFHGAVAGELTEAQMNEHDIMLLATGGQ